MLKFKCWLVYLFARCLYATVKVKITNPEKIKIPMILAVWHENVIASILVQKGKGWSAVVSHSKDGELVDFVMRKLDLVTIRGSSSKGGKEARESATEQLKKNVPVAFTVDGPRGPRHKVKPGCVDLCQKTGVPIIPYQVVASRNWGLSKTWDKTRIFKPFSTLTVRYGDPVVFTSEDFDQRLRDVENALNALSII